jgi:predicted alpha/beta-fold hydrolase
MFPDFAQRAPWWGGDLQTVRNRFFRGQDLSAFPAERLVLPMRDGSGDRLAAALHHPVGENRRPLVVLIHGLTGSEDSLYIRKSAAVLLADGYPVLRLNLRGAGPSRPLCRLQYHAGRTADLADALAALPDETTREGLFVVGVSLGGNMLLKFLGEGGAPQLRGAVSLSAPLDLTGSSRRIAARRNWLYHHFLLREMKRESLTAPDLSPEERSIVRGVRRIVEFDDRLTAPRNGFTGATEYYAKNSAAQFLDAITVPTLLIHAIDDPWVPADPYLARDWRRNPRLLPLLPRRGGHVGFHGRGSAVPWHDRCIVQFFARL